MPLTRFHIVSRWLSYSLCFFKRPHSSSSGIPSPIRPDFKRLCESITFYVALPPRKLFLHRTQEPGHVDDHSSLLQSHFGPSQTVFRFRFSWWARDPKTFAGMARWSEPTHPLLQCRYQSLLRCASLSDRTTCEKYRKSLPGDHYKSSYTCKLFIPILQLGWEHDPMMNQSPYSQLCLLDQKCPHRTSWCCTSVTIGCCPNTKKPDPIPERILCLTLSAYGATQLFSDTTHPMRHITKTNSRQPHQLVQQSPFLCPHGTKSQNHLVG